MLVYYLTSNMSLIQLVVRLSTSWLFVDLLLNNLLSSSNYLVLES